MSGSGSGGGGGIIIHDPVKQSESFNAFVDGLWNSAVTEAKKVETEVVALGENLLEEGVVDFEKLLQVGMPIAVQAILKEAPKEISGEEKFGNAVANVAQTLEAQLGPVAMGDVQTITQAAFRGSQKVAADAAAALAASQSAAQPAPGS